MPPFGEYFGAAPEDKSPPSEWSSYFGGPAPSTGATVRPCAVEFDEDYVYWAMRNLPIEEAVRHFLVCGAIGTGKTTIIDLFLQSIKERFRPSRRSPEQLIIFDAKGELVPKLAAMGYSVELDAPNDNNVWLLNPYDRRGCVWDISEAVATPLMARHFTSLLVPEESSNSTSFFWSSARKLVFAVITALYRTPVYHRKRSWDLRDLLSGLTDANRIRAITKLDRRAAEMAESVLGDAQHAGAIISTLSTKLSRFEEVAALWHTAPTARIFSIPEFLKRPGVLILGNDPVLRESLWPINAMLLKSITQEILRGDETLRPRHWFVLDEFPAMERVDSILETVNRGRSKGASVLIGLQGLDRLFNLYGQHGTNDLLEQLTYKTFLRAGGPETAQWIEKFFGQYRRTEESHGESRGKDGTTRSRNWGTQERSVFLASYFMNLPFTGPGRPIVAVNDIPCEGRTLVTRRSFDEVNAWRIAGDPRVQAVQARTNPEEQSLDTWDEPEAAEHCATPSPGANPDSPEPPLPNRDDIWND